MGDLMDFSLQADESIIKWEPLRKALPPLPAGLAESRLRIGPDWTALAGNWFVKWERTNDTKWRDRITTGMVSTLISSLPSLQRCQLTHKLEKYRRLQVWSVHRKWSCGRLEL